MVFFQRSADPQVWEGARRTRRRPATDLEIADGLEAAGAWEEARAELEAERERLLADAAEANLTIEGLESAADSAINELRDLQERTDELELLNDVHEETLRENETDINELERMRAFEFEAPLHLLGSFALRQGQKINLRLQKEHVGLIAHALVHSKRRIGFVLSNYPYVGAPTRSATLCVKSFHRW